MRAIYKRELKAYFQSMTGYAFIAFILLFTGIYFMAYNISAGYPYFAYSLSISMFMFLVAVPVLTMRSFAEEKKSRTDQLLLTSPVSLTEIVLGKYLAMVTVFVVPNLIFCLYPLIIKAQGTAYLLVDYISIAIFFLLGCVYIAIGMFLSSLTESQIIAAVSTFAVLLVLYLWDGLMSFLPSTAISGLIGVLAVVALAALILYQITKNWFLSAVLGGAGAVAAVVVYAVKASVYENLLTKVLGKFVLTDTFTKAYADNILDVSGIILCITLIIFFVFLTGQVIQKRRWS